MGQLGVDKFGTGSLGAAQPRLRSTPFNGSYRVALPLSNILCEETSRIVLHHIHSRFYFRISMSVRSSKRGERAEQAPGLFYLTRLTQLISSIFVASILGYFVFELTKQMSGIPTIFIVVSKRVRHVSAK